MPGRLRGKNVIDVEYQSRDIKKAIDHQIKNGSYSCDNIYGDGDAGEKIAEILSKVDFSVNKKITY